MAEKRKHDPLGSERARPLSDEEQRSASPQDGSAIVENYPRKRIAIAVSTT